MGRDFANASPASRRARPAHAHGAVLALLALLVGLLTACGEDLTNAVLEPLTPPEPTYAWIQANVFDARCIGCHSGAVPSQGLRLDSTNAPTELFKLSTEVGSLNIVTAGDPDNSYLVRKVEGGPAITGVRMPFGGPYLTVGTIQAIRDWITADATIP
jgi:hypothetical protein